MAEPRASAASQAGARSSLPHRRGRGRDGRRGRDQHAADEPPAGRFRTPLAIVVLIVGTAWSLGGSRAGRPTRRRMIETPAREPVPILAPLDRRAADVAALARETGRRHRRRWDRRRRTPCSMPFRAGCGRARGAGRHRRGHLVALVSTDPRRPALSRAVPVRPRARGARRTDADSSRWRRTWSGSSPSCSRSTAARTPRRRSTTRG